MQDRPPRRRRAPRWRPRSGQRCRRSVRSSGRPRRPRPPRARRARPPSRRSPRAPPPARALRVPPPGRGSAPRRAPGRQGIAISIARTASSTLQAPFASRRRAVSGPAAARTAATRPASSPMPTFTFRHLNPAATARCRLRGGPRAVERRQRRVDRHRLARGYPSAAPRPACPRAAPRGPTAPCRSRRSAAGKSSTPRQASISWAPFMPSALASTGV